MTLVPGSLFLSDSTGQSETISLQAVGEQVTVRIASAFYGADSAGVPKQAAIADDGQSLSITVLGGMNPLSVTVISPDPASGVVQLCQGTAVLAESTLTNHSAVSSIVIQGM